MGATFLVFIAAVIVAGVAYYYYKVYQHPKITERKLPYTQGLNYLLAGEPDKAKDMLMEAVRRDSENLDAYLKLGALLRQKGQPASAAKIHQSLTVRSDLNHADQIEVYKELALDYDAAGVGSRAAEYADRILNLSSDNRWGLEFRVKLAQQMNDWAAAFEMTRRLNSVNGKKDDALLALYRVEEGRALMESGKDKDGRVKCREAIKLDRSCSLAYLTLAKSYIRENREEDAVKELKNLLEAKPEHGYLAYDLMENLYFNLGRFDEIERLYRDIIRKRPEDLHAAQALARLLRKKGEFDRALRVCQEALERHPEDLWSRRFMISMLMENGRTDQIGLLVIELLDQVLAENPRFSCSACGYKTDEPLWRCPNCAGLGTFNL
ncbi:MAG: tetratricopeptide repeat protein [bacterium]|nr:tetratricopeptide repeat protein [bacterium]